MPEAEVMLVDLQSDLDLVRDAAEQAGQIAMRYFGQKPDVWLKDGKSPVSEADMAVDAFLKDALLQARPDYGWLSEETADTAERLDRHRTFVVDPIDGTRAFLEGGDVWCVSVAVVENGRSLVGVLDCPVRKEVFAAVRAAGSSKNDQPLKVRRPGGSARVAGPKTMIKTIPADLAGKIEPVSYVPSLAYRIAMVAGGEIDASFVRANAHDWDLAAADLILDEAGGSIVDAEGNRPHYAGKNPRLGPLVAGSGALLEAIAVLIAKNRTEQPRDMVP